MLKTTINKENLINAKGVILTKYQLFDTVFDDFAKQCKITVTRNGKEYQKTCIKPSWADYLMDELKTYCELIQRGKEYTIREVYEDRLAS